MARVITGYWRGGRWVVDAGHQLGALMDGGAHTFRFNGGGMVNPVNVDLRLHTEADTAAPYGSTQLWWDTSGFWDAGFDVTFPEAGSTDGCVDHVGADGALPNQAGTWTYGRNGWCPGMGVLRAKGPRMSTLALKSCRPLPPGTPALDTAAVEPLLAQLDGWTVADGMLRRTFRFADYDETMAFTNAVADLARAQDHHPDMLVQYNRCEVRYATHSVGGLSENDFICAARIDTMGRG